MRLFNVHTGEFVQYYTQIPSYVVASHRWKGSTETTLQDVQKKRNTDRIGYKKVERWNGYGSILVALNERNDAELSEAVNSMFEWYHNAEVCLAYLADVSDSGNLDAFRHSEWFARGWTLQELIAPQTVVFLTQDWQVIGHKGSTGHSKSGTLQQIGRPLEPVVASITGIPESVLRDSRQLAHFSNEEKLTWVDGRETTRKEDMSYCLFGLLDVAIGANYGEGAQKARRRLLAEVRKDPSRTPSSTVPFRRDRDFVDRRAVTDQIDAKLSIPAARAALVGLGGVGKSQLAIEYSYRLRERSPDTWVLWIHTSNSARFEQSVRDIAEQVKIKGRKDVHADIFELFRAWLLDAGKGSWLVVLDNADDPSFLFDTPIDDKTSTARRPFDYMPVCEHGSILITTRSKGAALQLVDSSDIIDVNPMEEECAAILLETKLGKHAGKSDFADLATVLDFMPLAITQAAAYIRWREPRCSVRQYLEELRDFDNLRTSLLDYDHRDHRRDGAAKNSIMLTWQISFQHIYRARRSAANLLSVMSLCDRQAIPEFLVRDRNTEDSALNDEFEDDVAMLRGFSFISTTRDRSTTFEMHRLVQLATRKWLEAEGKLDAQVEQHVAKLDIVFPHKNHEDWSLCQQLLPHVKSAFHFKPKGRLARLQWASAMQKAAEYSSSKGGVLLWTQAVEMGEQCWETMKRALGEEHPNTLASMSNLTGYYYRLGDSSKAAEIGEACWETRKRTLGEEHPDTLVSISNLAGYYNRLGDSSKAAEVGEQCWETMKRTLGEEHPNTLVSMSNLARYYYRLGNSSKAAEIGEQCWETRKRTLGEEHPNTLISMSNLARYYDRLGDSSKAAEIREQY